MKQPLDKLLTITIVNNNNPLSPSLLPKIFKATPRVAFLFMYNPPYEK